MAIRPCWDYDYFCYYLCWVGHIGVGRIAIGHFVIGRTAHILRSRGLCPYTCPTPISPTQYSSQQLPLRSLRLLSSPLAFSEGVGGEELHRWRELAARAPRKPPLLHPPYAPCFCSCAFPYRLLRGADALCYGRNQKADDHHATPTRKE